MSLALHYPSNIQKWEMVWIYSQFKSDLNSKIIPNWIPLCLHLQSRHAMEMILGTKTQDQQTENLKPENAFDM